MEYFQNPLMFDSKIYASSNGLLTNAHTEAHIHKHTYTNAGPCTYNIVSDFLYMLVLLQ